MHRPTPASFEQAKVESFPRTIGHRRLRAGVLLRAIDDAREANLMMSPRERDTQIQAAGDWLTQGDSLEIAVTCAAAGYDPDNVRDWAMDQATLGRPSPNIKRTRKAQAA